MKRKIRMGMVGGGADSWMGEVHRSAARMTGRIELVSGAFSATRQKSIENGFDLGLDPKRVYGAYRDMLKKEARLPAGERVDFIAIVTSTNMHYPVSMAAMDAGFDVLCEKPMTTSMDEALNLRRKQRDLKRGFCLMNTVNAYPMVETARRLVREGGIGAIRRVVAEYPRGWLAVRRETAGDKQAGWRTDPRRAGQSGSIGDLGTTAFALVEHVTGLRVSEVCADLHTFIPGRPIDDDGSVMLRFANGARGVLWASQVAMDESQGLRLRVYGDRGTLDWAENRPGRLVVRRLDAPAEVRDAVTDPEAAARGWFHARIGEGYIEACARLYRAFARYLDKRLDDPEAFDAPPEPYPGVEQGVRVMAFVEAVVRNQLEDSPKWTEVTENVPNL